MISNSAAAVADGVSADCLGCRINLQRQTELKNKRNSGLIFAISLSETNKDSHVLKIQQS
jgi:hypothetical protein